MHVPGSKSAEKFESMRYFGLFVYFRGFLRISEFRLRLQYVYSVCGPEAHLSTENEKISKKSQFKSFFQNSKDTCLCAFNIRMHFGQGLVSSAPQKATSFFRGPMSILSSPRVGVLRCEPYYTECNSGTELMAVLKRSRIIAVQFCSETESPFTLS